MTMKKKSIILPIYNGEKIVKNTLKILYSFIKEERKKEKQEDWEIIFVDDGSTDNTLNILLNFKPKFFKIISCKKNQGKGYAIKKGVMKASGEYIGFIDSDLAYPFENLKQAFNNLGEYDIVIGSRTLVHEKNKAKTTIIRRVFGKGFRILSNLLFSYHIPDTQCGLKVFKRRIAKYLFSKQKLKGFSFDTEILYLANKKNFKIKQIPAFLSKEHSYKKSTVNLIIDPIKMFFDIIKVRLLQK